MVRKADNKLYILCQNLKFNIVFNFQLTKTRQFLSWLPLTTPLNVSIIVSSSLADKSTIEVLREKQPKEIQLGPLPNTSIQAVVQQYLGKYNKVGSLNMYVMI